MVFKHFCFSGLFALEIDSGAIWGRFWDQKSTQNRPQEAPQRCWKSCLFSCAFQTLQKSIFEPTWPRHGSILAPKMASSWVKNGVKIDPRTVSEARSAPQPISGAFWVDFGSILGRFWIDFWLILDWFLFAFSCRSLFDFSAWSYKQIHTNTCTHMSADHLQDLPEA